MKSNTTTFTDANGTRYILDADTRRIKSTMDKHGFIYDADGKITGNIHGKEHIKGYHY